MKRSVASKLLELSLVTTGVVLLGCGTDLLSAIAVLMIIAGNNLKFETRD